MHWAHRIEDTDTGAVDVVQNGYLFSSLAMRIQYIQMRTWHTSCLIALEGFPFFTATKRVDWGMKNERAVISYF